MISKRNILSIVAILISLMVFGQEPSDSIPAIDFSGNHFEPNDTTFCDSIPDHRTWVNIEIDYPEYDNWEKVTLQGKLKMKGLPLSPSLKIFMQKDSLIDVSVRAPFVGEALRIEMSPDTITAVNKMNKTYFKEGINNFLSYYPGDLSDVQDLLLARFFLPGIDISESDLEQVIDIYFEENQYNVIPKGEAEIEGIRYGFVVDNEFHPLMLIVLSDIRPDIELAATYEYKALGYDIMISYRDSDKLIEPVLELKKPEWKGEVSKGIDLEKKYRRLDITDFINSIGN